MRRVPDVERWEWSWTRALLTVIAILVASSAAIAQPPAGAQGGPGGAPAQGAPAPGRGRGPAPQPRIITFEARPATIKAGESATLVWLVENPTAATIEPAVGRVTPRGSVRVTPTATTTYTLTVGTVTKSVTVTIPGTTAVAAATTAAASKKAITRTTDGKPDFSGVYSFGAFTPSNARGGGGANASPGLQAGGPQLKPGAEKYRVNRAANPLDTGATSDCMPLIPPNSFTVPYQFQIIQNKDYVVLFHEYPGTFRIVPLDGEPHQVDPDPSWLGDSVGHWEGDTLVIDTVGYNEKTEIQGYRHTEALHTVERLTRIEDGFNYELTVEDPNVFVAPWKVNRAFRFNDPPMKRIFEFVCENNRDYRPLFGDKK